jgi:hypothetical protein
LFTTPPQEYWQPNFEYNPTTNKYVLWYLYSKPNTTLGNVMVALADTPAGPFLTVNSNVTLKYRSFTSANIFVDRPSIPADPAFDETSATSMGIPAGTTSQAAPAAYVIYSSFREPKVPGMFPAAAVVERLNEDWTNTVPGNASSQQFGEGEGGIMFRWDRSVDANGSQTTSYYVLEGKGCCFCPTGSELYAWKAPHPFGPWVRGPQLNTPRPAAPTPSPPPLQPNPILATGQVSTTASDGAKLCMQANTSEACVPSGGNLDRDECTVLYRPCRRGALEQQWRLTQLGELQSALTGDSDPDQLMCLDAIHREAGQLLFTNFCLLAAFDTRPVGQLWSWDTGGAKGVLSLDSSGACAGQDSPVMGAACKKTWTLPSSTPLTPVPPPPPPTPAPNMTCHGCQVRHPTHASSPPPCSPRNLLLLLFSYLALVYSYSQLSFNPHRTTAAWSRGGGRCHASSRLLHR